MGKGRGSGKQRVLISNGEKVSYILAESLMRLPNKVTRVCQVYKHVE